MNTSSVLRAALLLVERDTNDLALEAKVTQRAVLQHFTGEINCQRVEKAFEALVGIGTVAFIKKAKNWRKSLELQSLSR